MSSKRFMVRFRLGLNLDLIIDDLACVTAVIATNIHYVLVKVSDGV